MKNWQITVLCFSIIISAIGAAFYIKYEPKTLLTTNYGPVDLGQVFSEKVMIDVDWVDVSSDSRLGDEVFLSAASYYDKSQPVDNALMELVDKWGRTGANNEDVKYNEIVLIEDDLVDVKIRTYIAYSSSNFMNTPYTLTIEENRYSIPKDKLLKNTIEEFVDKNFKSTKDSVSNSLFITDKVEFGLEESVNKG